MTAQSSDAAKVLPPRDFLIKDYELKVAYLTQHFSRMWTRFNYFVGIESALVGGKLILGDGKLSPQIAVVGAAVSLIWYVMGAEDRFLVRVYRGHVEDAGSLIAKALWDTAAHGPYCEVGETAESSKRFTWELSGWRVEAISTTRLAAWIPLAVLLTWLGVLLV
jgi:hypothetical protein